MAIRVLIIDDHNLFRSGLRSLLQREVAFQIVGEAGNADEGIALAVKESPDVILMDLHMPGCSGAEAVVKMLGKMPKAKVLMLTVSEDAQDLMDTLRAGAVGYLLKNIETATLVDALHRVVAGESVVSPQMTSKLVAGVRKQGGSEYHGREKLSPREKEILGGLVRGESNKEIARSINLSESTVKIHVQNIFKKLNITSRVQAAVYAVESGIVN